MSGKPLVFLLCVVLCGCAALRMAVQPPASDLDLQALLDDAAPGEVVHVPLGTYILRKSLEITRDNTTLVCEPGTRILITNVDEDIITVHSVTNVRIENAHLSHVKPLKEYDCHGSVVDIRNAAGVSVVNCDLNGCGALGVCAWDSQDLRIEHCWIHANTWNALYLHGCREVLLLANLIEDNANFLQMDDTTGFEASDNIVRNNGGYWRERDTHPGLLD
jgi:hypothetical protein